MDKFAHFGRNLQRLPSFKSTPSFEHGLETVSSMMTVFAATLSRMITVEMEVFFDSRLILLIFLMFIGHKLYAPCLRLVLCVMNKVTVFGFNLIQWALLCCMEWNNVEMEDLDTYQKLVASMFQATNARHAGESVFDLSSISSAILILLILMMYLPPYTTFVPIYVDDQSTNGRKERRMSSVESVLFSQLSYLVIFVILICKTERQSLREDPLNFNVLNISLEAISAFGNIGFSTEYSCKQQLKGDGIFQDLWIGFSEKWSNKGKLILILVMLFGRLEEFSLKVGKAWQLA